jgi:hypothetical protein
MVCANGHTDQWELVLYMRPLRQVFCSHHRNRMSAKIVVLSDVRSEPASSSWYARSNGLCLIQCAACSCARRAGY